MQRVLVLLVVSCLLALAMGQSSSSGATVQVANSDVYGRYLVDGNGMALYLLGADSKDSSTCTDACAQAWPPLKVNGTPTAGSGVAGSLLGTIDRADGSTQVTYNGIPLYTFVKDKSAGDTNGEGVNAFGGDWDLVSPYGVAVKPKPPVAPTQTAASGGSNAQSANIDPMVLMNLKGEGETVYSNICSVCHGDRGGGARGPKLVGDAKLKDTSKVVHQILFGGEFMPPLGDALSDEQVAGAATYIRTSWGNDFGPVTKEEVSQGR